MDARVAMVAVIALAAVACGDSSQGEAKRREEIAALERRVSALEQAAKPAAEARWTEQQVADFRALLDEVERRKEVERNADRVRVLLGRVGAPLTPEQEKAVVALVVSYQEKLRDVFRGGFGRTDDERRVATEKVEAMRDSWQKDVRALLPPAEADKILEGMTRNGLPGFAPRRPLTNVRVRGEAQVLAGEGKYQQAIDLIDREGLPEEKDSYASLKQDQQRYREALAAGPSEKREEEAKEAFQRQVHGPLLEQWKSRIPNEELAERLRQFLEKYADTRLAKDVRDSSAEPYPKLRSLLGEGGSK